MVIGCSADHVFPAYIGWLTTTSEFVVAL